MRAEQVLGGFCLRCEARIRGRGTGAGIRHGGVVVLWMGGFESEPQGSETSMESLEWRGMIDARQGLGQAVNVEKRGLKISEV